MVIEATRIAVCLCSLLCGTESGGGGRDKGKVVEFDLYLQNEFDILPKHIHHSLQNFCLEICLCISEYEQNCKYEQTILFIL